MNSGYAGTFDTLSGVHKTQHVYTPHHTWGESDKLKFLSFLWKVDYFKISLSTIHQIERFKVRNSKSIFWGGAHRAPSPDHPLLFLKFRLRFELRPQFSDALRPRFRLRPIRFPNFWSVVAPLQLGYRQTLKLCTNLRLLINEVDDDVRGGTSHYSMPRVNPRL